MSGEAGDGRVPMEEKAHGDLDVSRLRRDMVAMWREEGAAARSRGVATRACLCTLVVPGGTDEDGDALVDELVSLHPSRAVRIRFDPGRAPGTVESWVGGSCFRRPDGGSLVCSEIVHMVAGPDTDRRLASALRSLRVGGVPMFVVTPWTFPPGLEWLEPAEDAVDAVLADSASLSTPEAGALWRRCVASPEPRYGDVQWECLEDWRRAVASWFDRPGERATPADIRKVTLAVADTGGGRHKGLLLVGWLGSRLGWEPDTSGGPGPAFTLRRGETTVSVEIRPQPAGGDASLIRSVTLGFGEDAAAVRWGRLAPDDALLVESGDSRFRLNRTRNSPAASMLAFLRRPGPDTVADAAMRFAARLAGTP